MSFECPHCGWKNNELQPASEMQEQACRIVLRCTSGRDLNRQVVRTEWAEIRIPEIEFEISKQAGLITTIEGIIDRAVTGLQSTIPRLSDPDSVDKMSKFIESLIQLKSGDIPFTFVSLSANPVILKNSLFTLSHRKSMIRLGIPSSRTCRLRYRTQTCK